MPLDLVTTAAPAAKPKGKPGRKPLYASAADRQRAWRARKLALGQREVRTWTTAPSPAPQAPAKAA